MDKRVKKVSVNLTKDQYNMLEWLATKERRSVSELAFLILMDNAQLLFNERQPKGEWESLSYCPSKVIKID